MKILFVNYEYPPLGGGGGIAMMEIATALAAEHEVHVLTSAAPDCPELEKHAELNLTIHRVAAWGRNLRATASFASMGSFVLAGIARGKQLMREHRFDVINTWFAIPTGPVGSALAAASGVPHVLTIIGGDIYDPSKWYSPHRFPPSRSVVKRVIAKADAITAISTDILQRAQQHLGLAREVRVIPLGIPAPQFQVASRAELGLSPERKYIVSVGRLVRRKDYTTLINALKALDRDDTDLLLIGDGPEKDNLQQTAQAIGLADRVQFRGFVSNEEKYQLLQASDVFVLASLHEGFGIVYLEAMYCGLPIVAADQGGQLDILENANTGYLVPTGDVQSLSSALGSLLADEALSAEMSLHNKERFETFAIHNCARQYAALFQNTIDSNTNT